MMIWGRQKSHATKQKKKKAEERYGDEWSDKQTNNKTVLRKKTEKWETAQSDRSRDNNSTC